MKPRKVEDHARWTLAFSASGSSLSGKLVLVSVLVASLCFTTCTTSQTTGLEGGCAVGFTFYLPPAGIYDTIDKYHSSKEPVEIFALSKRLGLLHKRFPPGQDIFPREPFFAPDVAWTVVMHTGRVGDFFRGPFSPCKPGGAGVWFRCLALIQYPLGPVKEAACGKQAAGTLFLGLDYPESQCPGWEDFKLELAKEDGSVEALQPSGKRCEDLVLPLASIQAPGSLFLLVSPPGEPEKAIPVKIFRSLSRSKCYRLTFTPGPSPPFVYKVLVPLEPSKP